MNMLPDKAKYTIPDIHDIVERNRLYDILDVSHLGKPVFVIGQAAQGKSTLIASYLKQSDSPTAWMHLEKDDSEHSNFYQLFINSISHVKINFDIKTDMGFYNVNLGTRKDLLRQTESISQIMTNINNPVNIVIDNLEILDKDSKSFDLIYSIIKFRNKHIRLFVISREKPPFDIQSLKIKREILILRNRDIAFESQEVVEFFTQLAGIHVSSETSDQYKQEAFDYFFNEIFQEQTFKIKQFLMFASAFDIIRHEQLEHMTQLKDVSHVMDFLVRKNLFVHSIIDDELHISYRFNNIFRDFLRVRFDREIPNENKKDFYFEAAENYQKSGHYEESLKFYLKAEQFDQAVEMIIKTGLDFLITGRSHDLAENIQSLPDKYIEKEPWIYFLLTLCDRIRGGIKNLNNLHICYQKFSDANKIRGQLLSLAYSIEVLNM